jgi:hypothetical protein
MMELSDLAEFHDVMEEAIVKHMDELANSFRAQSAGMSEAAFNESVEWGVTVERKFPQVLRSSLFVTCYTMLEVELEMLCQVLKSELRLRLVPSDLKGQGVKNSQAYIKKVAGLEFPDQSRAWVTIVSLADIRNVVVHMRGLLADNNASKSTRKFAKSHPNLVSVGDHGRLELSNEFCPFVIRTLSQLATDLLRAVGKLSQT